MPTQRRPIFLRRRFRVGLSVIAAGLVCAVALAAWAIPQGLKSLAEARLWQAGLTLARVESASLTWRGVRLRHIQLTRSADAADSGLSLQSVTIPYAALLQSYDPQIPAILIEGLHARLGPGGLDSLPLPTGEEAGASFAHWPAVELADIRLDAQGWGLRLDGRLAPDELGRLVLSGILSGQGDLRGKQTITRMVITPAGSVESAEMVVAEPWSMASADWIVTRLDIRKASGKPWQGVAETTKPYALLANLEWDDRANAKHSWPVRVAVSAMPKPNGKPGDVPSLGFAGQLDVTATRGPWVSGTLSVAGAGKETSKWHSLGQVELRPGKDGQQAIIELHGARLDLAYSGGDDKAVLTLADLLPGLGTKMDMQGVVVIQTRMAWGGAAGFLSWLRLDIDHADLRVAGHTWRGLQGRLAFNRLDPLVSEGPQNLRVDTVEGTPLHDLATTLRWTPESTIQIDRLEARMGSEGLISARPFALPLSGGEWQTELALEKADLGALLDLLNIEGLGAQGTLSGTLPMRWKGGNLDISGGQLSSEGPGQLRYDPAHPPAFLQGEDSSLTLLREALRAFSYDVAALSFEDAGTQGQRLNLRLEGRNPNMQEGRPVILNVTLNGALWDVLTASSQAANIGHHLETRMQPAPGGKKRQETPDDQEP